MTDGGCAGEGNDRAVGVGRMEVFFVVLTE